MHEITPSEARLQLLIDRLDTQLNEPTNQISKEVPKVVKPNNKKTPLSKVRD